MTDQEYREQLYETMTVKHEIVSHGVVVISNVPAIIESKTNRMIAHKDRYLNVAHRFKSPGLKWPLVALIHEMECSQNFNCYLGNGQRLDRKTTIVPIGRGPFNSFEDGAEDALKLQGADKITDWSIGNILYFLESYNGFGYSKYHNINTPYLWSGSNHYSAGKYVSDGKFDPNAVSSQIGIALLMKNLLGKID